MINSYIAVDLETTGLKPAEDRILEIGAVKVVDGQVQDTYETLVNAGVPISPRIRSLTGITEEMAANGKETAEAVRELIEFCGELPLLGHNILFDFSFIKHNAVNQKLVFEKEGIDTLKIARKLLNHLESKSLESICAYYHIRQESAHRAASDALSAMEIYRRMREEFPDSPDEIFLPAPLICQAKRRGPITEAQKGYLNDLIKYHKINMELSVDSLTKNEASRIIDKIILEHGRIVR